MPPDSDLIATWLAVRRHGSLSAAARALRLSQPTVRRRIEALERQVGTALFVRETGGLIPIAAGADLLALAETIEAAALAFGRAAQGEAAGTVRLSCPAVFAVEILPPLLADLRRHHPAIAVELSVTNQIADLLRHEADIALRLTTPRQDRIVARKVAPVVVGLYAAPGPVADQVAAMDYATFRTSAPFIGDDRRDLIARGFAALGLPLPERHVLRTDDDLAQLAAIRAGIGVGICQRRIAEKSGLTAIFPNITLSQDAWVVTHEDLRHLPRVRAVFDALVADLA